MNTKAEDQKPGIKPPPAKSPGQPGISTPEGLKKTNHHKRPARPKEEILAFE
ncbi:hypothetical protein MASR1M66_01890 [Aminivibrio sp.]